MNDDLKHKICCLEMLNAVLNKYIDEVVSGFFFPNQDDRSCKSGVPRVKFCPFCGKEFETLRNHDGACWDWRVKC